jgi:Spy/CpxP family protein refolding chaperone
VAQKEERLKEIKVRGAERMHQILGPEQLKQAIELHGLDELGPYSVASLARLSDLTPAQKQRIEAIHREAQKQFMGTLTIAQRAKLKQLHGGQ